MYFIIVTLLLVVAYIGILVIEAKRGARFFEAYRARLDRVARRGTFIIEHVDFASFAREEVRQIARRLVHGAAHHSLSAVRAIERLLTKFVRRLRMHSELARPTGESTRTFVRTLSEFKGQLETRRPEVQEIR